MKEIPLTRGYVALVDDEDYERVSRWKWYAVVIPQAKPVVYARRKFSLNGKKSWIPLHRFIMDAKPGQFVDHINGNTLDCRRSVNLRFCTKRQNQINQMKRSNTSCPYKGVARNRTATNERWFAYLRSHGRTYTKYGFAAAEDAARAYDDMAREHFGEFARLNFPRDGEQSALDGA